jgi:hypothetical protein
MTEHELRLLVRQAIAARHAAGAQAPAAAVIATPFPFTLHASHGQFEVPSGIDACIIEPSVPCTHCGFCKSYGH